MTDNLTKEQRSYCMSNIRSKYTKPELIIKIKLKKKNFVYHPRLYGKPDFANFKKRTAIFIDGCFWHRCPKHFVEPKSNKKYWLPKIERNVLRDKEIIIAYLNAGWKVTRIWEHELRI